MNSQCTILIPTHNRARYLQRCVNWFLDLGYPIVIADSSDAEWQSALRNQSGISYLHVPGGFEIYVRKLHAALETIATPFVAMCADDDFITGEGLATCVTFLQAHPDYSFSQGYAYLYQAFGTRLAVWPMPYDHDVPFDSWLDRIERAQSTVYYGVNRTAVLRSALGFLVQQDFSEIANSAAGFFDFTMTSYAAKCGKFKRCPVPFGLREYSPVTSAVGTRFRTITSRNIPDFYRNLLAFLADGGDSEATRTRLLRHFGKDFAGQITYDLSISAGDSKKRHFARLPERWVTSLEYLYRLYNAARLYASSRYIAFSRVFFGLEYRRFKKYVMQ